MTLTSFLSQFDTQVTGIMVLCLIPTILEYLLIKIGRRIKIFKILFWVIIVVASAVYFGPIPLLKLLLIALFSVYLGYKIFSNKNLLINSLVGFFITIETYTLLALISNPKIALTIILLFSFILLLTNKYLRQKILAIFNQTDQVITQLNLIDLFLINFCFLLGSQPQQTWDASQANLYNAKWYVEHNSLKPLEESVSSLMPQNAIIYYSLFYQIGKYYSFQIAYLLPLIFCLIISKFWFLKFKFSYFIKILFSLLFFTPMVIFQSSSGYYDFYLFSVVFLAVTILLTTPKHKYSHILLSTLLISYAAGIKFFPLVLISIPAIFFITRLPKYWQLNKIVILFLAITLPLGIWLTRDYLYTGNPFFPFAQKIFPTPNFSETFNNQSLEDHPMIQTSMTNKNWFFGGFIKYPLLSYISTGDFFEGTNGYPTIMFIPLIIIQLLILVFITFKLLRHQTINNRDIIFILIFTSFLLIGSFTRYYRYLWPYQLLLACTSFIYINQTFLRTNLKKLSIIILLPLCLYFLYINTINIRDSFRYHVLHTNQMFSPDYTLINPGSLPFQIIRTDSKFSQSSTILDLSRYVQPRLNVPVPVFQCNWYWTAISTRLSNGSIDTTEFNSRLLDFDYIITSEKDEDNTTYCQKYFDLVKTNFTLISNINGYKIYSNNN